MRRYRNQRYVVAVGSVRTPATECHESQWDDGTASPKSYDRQREDPEKDQPLPRTSLGAIDRRPANHSERKVLDIVDDISYQKTEEAYRVHCALSKIRAAMRKPVTITMNTAISINQLRKAHKPRHIGILGA